MRTLATFLFNLTTTLAFVLQRHFSVNPNHLFITKRDELLIDAEYFREKHPEQFKKEWMKKNKEMIFHIDPEKEEDEDPYRYYEDMTEEEYNFYPEEMRDRRLAHDDPQRYCQDRCISTGHCDVYEDAFHFTPEEVLKFCKDCVLSDGEEACPIPDAFFEKEDGLRP